MSETLLDKSKTNLKIASTLLMYNSNDEAVVTYVGYHLQQSVELLLKHRIEISGFKYTHTHITS